MWFGCNILGRRSGGRGPKPFPPVFKSVPVLRRLWTFGVCGRMNTVSLFENFIKQRGSLTPWHFEASFLFAFHDQSVNTETIRDFVFHSKQLGRIDGDHFLCELLPLPRKNKASMKGYESVWDSVKDYVK